MKVKIPELLTSTCRDGVKDLIEFLNTSDFYTAPCSTKYHLAVPGGLAEHTHNVFCCADSINKQYDSPLPFESIIIASICHDLCKINTYKEVNEDPSDAQKKYLVSLLVKANIRLAPDTPMNKAYASVLIDFMLKSYKPGCTLPEYVHNYQVDDQLPIGHGEKSIVIAQQFITLTVDEMLAIRWHMGACEAGVNFPYPTGYAYRAACEKSKLVPIIMLADTEASFLMEAK